MPLKLNSTGGGSVTLDTPSTASAYTLTVPAITGTAVVTGSTATVSQTMLASGVAGNGPAFRAFYNTGATTVSSGVLTKAPFNAETFDTANCFDSTTNYRFTPNVAGYYQLNAVLYASATAGYVGQAYPSIYKNGVQYAIGNTIGFNGNYTGGMYVSVSDVAYANGTTDYFEIYAYIVGTGTLAVNGSSTGIGSTFSGCMVRSA